MVTTSDELPEALRAFVALHLGTPRRTRFCGWPHRRFGVWRLEGRTVAFVKVWRQPQKSAQERRTYREWLPQLTLQLGPAATPTLLAESGALRALLVPALPGALLGRLRLPPPQLLEAYRQAGSFLSALHRLPFADDDPVPLGEATPRAFPVTTPSPRATDW